MRHLLFQVLVGALSESIFSLYNIKPTKLRGFSIFYEKKVGDKFFKFGGFKGCKVPQNLCRIGSAVFSFIGYKQTGIDMYTLLGIFFNCSHTNFKSESLRSVVQRSRPLAVYTIFLSFHGILENHQIKIFVVFENETL